MGSETTWRPGCGALWRESAEKARRSAELAGLGESIPEMGRLCGDIANGAGHHAASEALPLAGVKLLGEGERRRPSEGLWNNLSCKGVVKG